MQVTRNSLETNRGPSDWFTGAVYIDTVATPSNGSPISASSVHFTPGARTAWHTHPNGQTIWVTEGLCLCQRRGGPVEVIRPGDRVFLEPGEDHWRRPEPVHDPPRHATGRRPAQRRHLGRPRHRPGVRGRTAHPGRAALMADVDRWRELSFSGRSAVVTGAARGIGRAVAYRLAGLGARTVIWDRDGKVAERTAIAGLRLPRFESWSCHHL
jgi:quercetin dioxygenase-like cupin family protein